MIANLYLHTDYFKYNNADKEDDVNTKLNHLISDLTTIYNIDRDNNIVFVSKDLCIIPIFKEKTILEFANNLEREEKNFLFQILCNTSNECDMPIEELNNLCIYHEDENVCNAIIKLNTSNNDNIDEYMTFENYQVVYNHHSWLYLRRQILGNHPGNADEFMENCYKYFPNTIFNEHCKESIKSSSYLRYVPRKIVYYLSCLDEFFIPFWKKYSHCGVSNPNEVLKVFANKYNLDEPGSLQGNFRKKKKFTYPFRTKNGEKDICCEAHLKISSFDKNYKKGKGDNENSFCARIYFNFGDSEIEEGEKVLIGSIGPHI